MTTAVDPYRGVKPGDRVRMTGRMPQDPDPIPVGQEGTVQELVGTPRYPQIDVKWDSGRTLYLLPSDPFRVVERGWPVQ